MYYQHFGLDEPPFKITPNTGFFFAGGNRGAILEALIYAISQGEGIVKVTGEVGSGKTMLCRMLQSRLPEQVESVYLANPNLAPEDILHAIAFELQLPVSAQSSRFEVMQTLQQHLLARHTEGKRVVVFVEEAQGMPLPTLEEVRLLSNLETERDKLLQIVLFGQPELDANISRTEMRQLRERITHSFNLAALRPEEIRDYLGFRLRTAGYHGPDLFDAAVVRHIAEVSKGLTRRVNILADKSMLAAFADNTHNITLKHAQTAANDSEFGNEFGNEFGGEAQPRLSWWKAAAAAAALLALGIVIGVAINRPAPPAAVPPPPVPEPAARAAPAATPVPPSAPSSATTQPLPAQPAISQAVPLQRTPAAPFSATGLLESRLAATETWLASQPADTLTIQLTGSDSSRMLKRYLTDLGRSIEPDQLFVFHTRAGGKPSMTVTYGSFPARKAATEALQALPDNLKRNNPLLRSVKGIRAEIQQARDAQASTTQ